MLQLVHINNNDFISHSIRPIITNNKLDRNLYTGLGQQFMMTSSTLDHVVNIYGFISSSISVVTTNIGMIIDQHAIELASS